MDDVLKQLGIPMATAIDMYLRQISLIGGIPLAVSLPKAPASINADNMTAAELYAALKAGYDMMIVRPGMYGTRHLLFQLFVICTNETVSSSDRLREG